ncbi:MAG TPA: SH3 domain-containing protein, partial [Allomuricauda sp.]|nr:SH3 domain-containing protein [Allomuricauda sp.]
MKFPSLRINGLHLVLLIALILSACNTEKSSEADTVDDIIASIKEKYAPDKRIALFDVESEKNTAGYIIKGKTNLPEALNALEMELESQQITYTDSIEVLPATDLEGEIYGVITNSVANIRSQPSHSSELVTQATLGMPLNVYQKDDNWYQIQTPDKYLGWVDSGG